MHYATVSDLEAGWRVLSETERGIAAVLLDRASAKLDQRILDAGKEPCALTRLQREIAASIVCDAVSYTMDRGNIAGSQFMGDAGDIYADSMQGGEVRITDAHMRMLGIGGTRAGILGPR